MFILSANIILANAPLYPFRVCVIFPSILSRLEGVKNLVICHRWLAGHGELPLDRGGNWAMARKAERTLCSHIKRLHTATPRRVGGDPLPVTCPAFTVLKKSCWHYNGKPVAPTASGQQKFSAGVNSLPSALATSGWVTVPRQILSPALKAGSSFIACRYPFSASARAYGKVALVSAKVDVRARAPGILVTQ